VELGNLPDQPLEGRLPNEQLSALLVLANFTGGGTSGGRKLKWFIQFADKKKISMKLRSNSSMVILFHEIEIIITGSEMKSAVLHIHTEELPFQGGNGEAS